VNWTSSRPPTMRLLFLFARLGQIRRTQTPSSRTCERLLAPIRRELTCRDQRGISYSKAAVDYFGPNIKDANSPKGATNTSRADRRASGAGRGEAIPRGTGETGFDRDRALRDFGRRATQTQPESGHGSPSGSATEPASSPPPNSVPVDS
jgi:hypothetical protein